MSSYIASPHALEDLITLTNTANRSDLIVPTEGQLILEKSYIIVTTLVNSVSAPVLQILDGSTELATVTLLPAEADNTMKRFVLASGIAPIRRFASGATLGVKVKTAAGTAGVVRAVLMIQWPEATS